MWLAHLTDVHVARPEDYPAPDQDKLRAQAAKHSEVLLARLLDDLAAQRPDHVVLSGDLTLTSLPAEFERARAHLDRHLGGLRRTVIHGNHDVWTAEARPAHFDRLFGADATCELRGGRAYPFVHRIGEEVALFALDSCPFGDGADPAEIHGRVDAAQLAALRELGARPEVQGRFRIAVLHHHLRLSAEDAALPDPKDGSPLSNAAEVAAALVELRADLVLHGHRHKQMRVELEGGGRRVPVLCPGSATRLHERPDRTGRYALYRIERGALREVRLRAWSDAAAAFVDAPAPG